MIDQATHALAGLYRYVREEVVPGARELRFGELPNGRFQVAVTPPEGTVADDLVREWDHAPSGEELLAALHSIGEEVTADGQAPRD